MTNSSSALSGSSVVAPAGATTEVVAKAVRRRFTAAYKLRILQAAEQCSPGEVGTLLRREGLYSSHLTTWRHQRDAGQLAGLTPKARGPKPDPQAEENARLGRENERLQARLQQAEAIIEAQKKIAQLFGLTSTEFQRAEMIQITEQLAQTVPLTRACAELQVPRSTLYRTRRPRPAPKAAETPGRRRALSADEKGVVRDTLNSERFQDEAPREVFATLLDEGTYLCSVPTMYRILRENQEIRERRDQLRHPAYVKPELLATAPNQVWSWDITKLLGPVKWTYFYLYVLLDIFSRFVVGWLLADRESTDLAQVLIAESCTRQMIGSNQLTIHADRGAPMTAKPLVMLLADLQIGESHSRPHVSNDNPFSEAQFKTLKYQPTYPERFGSQVDARTWAQDFFRWYNFEHHHAGIGLMTPAAVHSGQAAQLWQNRQSVLQQVYAAYPERFVKGLPKPPALPTAVWINPPKGTGTPSPQPVLPSVDTEDLH
ncbi:MAG: IS3 family transposase [Acidobacteriales bacterium]|nr:IS3 family transposase [Terriglobales bacterium]